jgi:hypothetical protein
VAVASTLWLANLTGAPVEVRLRGLGGPASAWMLDAAGFEDACLDPDGFAARRRPLDPAAPVRLDAYAVARIDPG